MTSIAASERAHLATLAEQLGPDVPTLCEGWTARDLVVHLVLREGHPAAVGLALPPLAGYLRRTSAKLAEQDFGLLLQRLREGPPRYSVFALPRVGAALNLTEFFVHHEDLRRAQAGWSPRELPRRTEDALWRAGAHVGKALAVRSRTSVVAERRDTGERQSWGRGDPVAVLRGMPSELTLYGFGRQAHAAVEKDGDPAALATLDGATLGI